MSQESILYALVADDDAMIRMDAVAILEDAGFGVHEAGGYEEAMAILADAADSIHLLFTDVQMPPGKMNGFHLARQCAESWPHINILVASGMMEPAPGDMPKGAVFVKKPFSAEVVYVRLQEILPDGAQPEKLRRRFA
jgi:DNA-binding NtrC family response regulator